MPFQFVLDQVKVNDGAVAVKDATGASDGRTHRRPGLGGYVRL